MSFSQNSLIHNYNQLKGKYHFLKFAKNPYDTSEIFKMTESFQKATTKENINLLLSPLLEIKEIQQAYDNKYWPKLPKLSDLKHYPRNSFGYQAYQFFMRFNLNPDLFPEPDFSTPQTYITSRIYQAHDYWHVLTDYDTSLESELALQAFGVGQYKQPLSLTIIIGGLIHILEKSPEKSYSLLDKISEGFERGKNAVNLLAHPLIERLDEPLLQIQTDFNIKGKQPHEV